MAAGLAASSDLGFAPSAAAMQPSAEIPAVIEAEANLGKIQQSFSGLVRRTDNGLVLETADGMYRLKGLSLEEIVGKEVYVTGLVKTDQEDTTIYVVKADVKN